MSYVRWGCSLPISSPCPRCGRGLDEIAQIQADSRFCSLCTSPWYIYDSHEGVLAVWAKNGSDDYFATYEEVQEMVESGDYSRIPGFAEYGDCGVVENSLKQCLETLVPEG
jgi:predicted amidophosphoribosyltransferase